MSAQTKTYAQYNSLTDALFIGKGTLENVITGKGLISNTDWATTSTGGVFKLNQGYAIGIGTSSGNLYAVVKTFADYDSLNDNAFIGKGTLENVITGKGLVSNTDYASSSTAGVVKANAAFGTQMGNEGLLYGAIRTYEQYNSAGNNALISKGTLENVITGKELDLKQLSTFDSTKTQILKNINGTLTWIDE